MNYMDCILYLYEVSPSPFFVLCNEEVVRVTAESHLAGALLGPIVVVLIGCGGRGHNPDGRGGGGGTRWCHYVLKM